MKRYCFKKFARTIDELEAHVHEFFELLKNPEHELHAQMKRAIRGLTSRLTACKFLNGGHVDRKSDRLRAEAAKNAQILAELERQARAEEEAQAIVDQNENLVWDPECDSYMKFHFCAAEE